MRKLLGDGVRAADRQDGARPGGGHSLGGGDGGSYSGKRSGADADEDLVGRGWGGEIFLQRGDEGRGDGASKRAGVEDGLVVGPEPGHGGGGGFEDEAEHGIVSG